MDKEKIKKTLASLSLAGLIASVGMMSAGCAKTEEAQKDAAQDTQVEAAADTTQADSTASGD